MQEPPAHPPPPADAPRPARPSWTRGALVVFLIALALAAGIGSFIGISMLGERVGERPRLAIIEADSFSRQTTPDGR